MTTLTRTTRLDMGGYGIDISEDQDGLEMIELTAIDCTETNQIGGRVSFGIQDAILVCQEVMAMVRSIEAEKQRNGNK